jgi:nitric oxide reductase large subunit
MDTTQLLLSTAVTITTILLIIVSVQLISLLKQLKKDHGKEDKPAVKSPEIKKDKVVKKMVNLTTLLEKMKSRISHPHSSNKIFFKS